MKRLSFFVFLAAFLPQIAAAQVSISEIMYNPKGVDTGREWVEIFNDGTASVDLTGWKFNEANTNHGLTAVRGGTSIPASGYAVIADDTTKFLADFPNFSGVLFDSSFLLNNTGETIAFKDNFLNIIDFVTYSVDQGANDDGNSLQKINGAWSAVAPTPGVASVGSSANLEVQSPNGGAAIETGGGDSIWPEYIPPEKASHIKIEIVAGARATAGAAQKFEARVYGTKNDPVGNARVLWNFGDGARGEGRIVAHAFSYPGTYSVVADAASGEYAATMRLNITVESNTLYISEVNPGATTTAWLEIANPSGAAADLSGWFLAATGGNFIFPDHSILAPRSFVVFTSENTGLDMPLAGAVKLLYPNGKAADNFIYSDELGEGQTFQRADGKVIALKASPGVMTKVQNVIVRNDAPAPAFAPSVPIAPDDNLGAERPSGEEDLAAVATAVPDGNKWWFWLAASAALGLFGVVAFFLMKYQTQKEAPVISKEADEFEIEELKNT